ncbi:ATP-dependent acyl-CoA ligase [Amorphus orientalis]|uniref:Crotonobetaine/carnitine-CoA ligase n=1 Tax=Amorphus orientalis TaxID=649198 RepID=A0AAE4ASD1_9HYPH|nr:ATP-dependent acyl-CoA ligase [Amorphus orientalis]MDQ0313859.1 crotonobetaine/carnitine-CoA ligase [Amorphus orientalis]
MPTSQAPSGPVVAFPPETRTVPQMLLRQAERYGDAAYFRCDDTTISFAELLRDAKRYAALFASAGVAKGDRVAMVCGNDPEFVRVFFGLAWLGAVSVPINTASRGFQFHHMLSNSGAKILVIQDQFVSTLETADFSDLPVERIWVFGDGDLAEAPADTVLERLPEATGEVPAGESAPGDLLTILYTSGTTGLSKGVCCPHAQFFWWAVYTGRQLGVREGDVLHTPLPLFHTNALNCSFQALLHGATQVVERRFSVTDFWPALNRSGATVTYLLGAMVPMLLSRDPTPAEGSHTVRVALAPGVPENYHAPFTERTGVLLLDGFGTTETNAVIASTPERRRPGWMGCVIDGVQARVVDEQDNEVPDGTPGELVLRADEPFAFADGYFAMPEKTVETWRNLWLHTGDRVERSPDGFYRFIDRMKDAIRRRGENISSYEVEQVLTSHPAVSLAAVFPVRSELAEDEVMAALVLKEGAQASEEEIVRFCEGKMSYFAVPRFVEFVQELPRTESGKIQKFKLRERGRSETTWDREAAGVTLKR